jgi:type IV secretion system protein VirB6
MAGIAQTLEAGVDTLLTGYVTAKSAAVSAAIAPVALTGVTIYVLLMGFAIMRGEAHDSLQTFLWRSAKIAFIAGLALSAGEFQSSVIGMVEGVQSGLTSAVSGAGSIGALVDNLAQPYNDLGEALWTRAVPAGVFSLPSFSLIFAAALVAIAQFFLFVIGLGMYLLAKVALALVLAVGPVFILCAMFPGTQRYAESWIGQALNFALLNVLIAASIAMLTQFASDFARAMLTTIDTINILRDVASLLLATGALGIVLLNLERISSALAGGVSIQGIGRDLARAITSRPQSSARPSAPAGGQIQSTPQRPALPGPPSSGGTIDAYQRGVQEHIRLSSTQGS